MSFNRSKPKIMINLITLLLILHVISVKSLFDNEINLECSGYKVENVTLTAYYPDYANEENQNGYLDKMGAPLKTLQDYIDDRHQYVSVAMDPNLNVPYGQELCIPHLNLHFGHRIRARVVDSSEDLRNAGLKRADICVRSEVDSYDSAVNLEHAIIYFKV